MEEYSVFYNLLNYKADGQITLISSGGCLADNAKAIVFLQECMQKSKVLMCYLYAETEILFQRILKKFYAEKTFPAFLGGADCKKEAEKQFEELYFRRTCLSAKELKSAVKNLA